MKTLAKIITAIILIGLGLGFTLMLGDTLFDPIIETYNYSGSVRSTVIEVVGHRILQVTGILFIWTIAVLIYRFVLKEAINSH